MVEIPIPLQKPQYRFIKIKPHSKQPIEHDWQEKANYPHNSPELLKHLERGGNYGVLCGKNAGNLVVIDADRREVQKAVEEFLPPTFTVKTGRGGRHYYYTCKDLEKNIRLKDTIIGDVGDVQWNKKQVIGANSIHPNGNKYEAIILGNPVEIKASQIRAALHPWIIEESNKFEFHLSEARDGGLKISNLVDLSKLKKRGSEYQGSHPIHGSTNEWNFCINPEKNAWHCFRHDTGGGVLSWIAVKEGLLKCEQCVPGALKGELFLKVLEIAKQKYGYSEKEVKPSEGKAEKAMIATEQEWVFENILPKEHFVSKYIEKGVSLTDAYPEYHFAGALNILSTVANRAIRVELVPKPFYTNIWVTLIGLSTVSRKSTALNLAKMMLERAGIGRHAADEATPEALIDILRDDAQINLVKDEFGLFLARARRKYQSGIDSLLSLLYDCPDHYKKRLRKETIEARDVYISMFAGMVPSQVALVADSDEIQSGFFPRMLFVFAERHKVRKNLRTLTFEDEKTEEELAALIRSLHEFIQGVKNEGQLIHAILTKKALDRFNEWCAEWEDYISGSEIGADLAPFFGRASITAVKIATLLEISAPDYLKIFTELESFNSTAKINRFSKLVMEKYRKAIEEEERSGLVSYEATGTRHALLLPVTLQSMDYAIFYVSNLFLPYAQKLVRVVNALSGEKMLERVYELAVKHSKNGFIEHADLLRLSNMKSKDFKECISTLQESGKIHVSLNPKGGKIYTPLLFGDGGKQPRARKPVNKKKEGQNGKKEYKL